MKKILILEDNIKSAAIIEKTLYEISNKIQVFHVTCVDKAYPIIVNNRIDISKLLNKVRNIIVYIYDDEDSKNKEKELKLYVEVGRINDGNGSK